MVSQPDRLLIPDLHEPFAHPDFLDFTRDVARRYKTKATSFAGDIVDHHAISYHEHDADGMSPGAEFAVARKRVAIWTKAYPEADFCIGNHDELIARKARTAGLPSAFIKSFQDAYSLPKKWRVGFSFIYGNKWKLQHGTGTSGDNGAYKAAMRARISLAQAHLHTASSVKYHACDKDLIWAMQLGWGGNRKSYAFAYGKDFQDKPILSLGVVLENGTLPLIIPMPL